MPPRGAPRGARIRWVDLPNGMTEEHAMAIKVVNLLEMAAGSEQRRQVLMNGPRFHTWLHIYPTPGDRDEMHCHNADESFYILEGECTMHFPDCTQSVMRPGMVALIPGGQ